MKHVLSKKKLSVDDVLCVPTLGKLKSRSEAQITPFIYSAPMDRVTGYAMTKELLALGHVPVICRTLPEEEWNATVKEFAENPRVFIAIGLGKEEFVSFWNKLTKLGIRNTINVAIDVAHGDMEQAHELTAYLRELGVCRYIMSGSICTPEAAARAQQAGCTHLRVGIGPGSACTTRIETGCGYPQLSAVFDIDQSLKANDLRSHVHVIADGGIRNPGDVVKYLSAGADAVMMGSVLATALEACGWQHGGYKPLDLEGTVSFPVEHPEPIYIKDYRGQASESFQRDNGKPSHHPEGIEYWIEWDGTKLEDIVKRYEAKVASAISYLGCTSVIDLGPETVKMIKVTANTALESKPREG
jgi:IMP dehydrogenase